MPISFPPVINENTVQLIIGTMPGEASLAAQQYYAHKQNKFWQIVHELFDAAFPPESYESKLDLLLKNRTGLWDALEHCEREGSLDSKIKHGKPNDFPSLFKTYPNVRRLFFNGKKAYELFTKHFDEIQGMEYVILPSTSPANATKKYPEKLAEWAVIKNLA